MNEVSKKKAKLGGHDKLENEGSAARTRPTSVEEIMLRRKKRESLQNVKEEPIGAVKLIGNHPAEKASDYNGSEKRNPRSEKPRREEHTKDSSRKKEDVISSSREEKLDKPMKKEEPDANKKTRAEGECSTTETKSVEEHITDKTRKKEEVISSCREEKLDKSMKKEEPAANKKTRAEGECSIAETKLVEEHIKDRPRKKEDVMSSSRAEKLDKEMKKEEPAANKKTRAEGDSSIAETKLVEEHVISSSRTEKLDKEMKKEEPAANKKTRAEGERSIAEKKLVEEHIKDIPRKKEDVISSSREEKLDKPMKKGEPAANRKTRAEGECSTAETKLVEEQIKDRPRKKEDVMSSSRAEKLDKEMKKEEPAANKKTIAEGERYIAETKVVEEHIKDRPRKKDVISSSREEKLDKPMKKEEPAANKKTRAEGECSIAETKLVKEHIKDRPRKKEEPYSSYREKKFDKQIKKEDVAETKRKGQERECPPAVIKPMTGRDGLPAETRVKRKRDTHTAKTTEKWSHPWEAVRDRRSGAHGNLHSRKRLRSLVVTDIPRDEDSIKTGKKRKHHSNDNGIKVASTVNSKSQRHDARKVHTFEGSERREKWEQPKLHQRDIREKRRRSRSRDHGQDRHKRSSPLPRAEKATPHFRRDEEKLSEIVPKDRPGKHHYSDHGNKLESSVSSKSKRYRDSKSELGGYSPRKRREEASAKAASPPNLLTDKKGGKWDLVPSVTTDILSGSVFSGLQVATQTEYPTINEASLMQLKSVAEVSFRTPPAKQTTSVDSVQLTESTRRMRRLYAENVPDSASEKALIECFNGYMLSSGSNHVQGSEPCISCIINKEKSQALVEFLTPQDASAALSLDGCFFAGSNLKIRRPKDYVETTSGELEKKETATNVLTDKVEDSSNKIFIGGFPKSISSEMLKEIVSVFGPLKAYRFGINNVVNQQCSFLEYTDGSVTLKACAGLSGMKLGGSVLTAVRAFPDASSIAGNENQPFYGIPEHAKPLLGKPTHVLKLKNVVNPEDLPSLSEPEVKEILEDVRLECGRFGAIKSINIVEHQSGDIIDCEIDASLNPELTDSKEMNASVIPEKDEGSKNANDIADSKDPTAAIRPDSSTREDKLCEPVSETAAETKPETNSEEHEDQVKVVGEMAHDVPENPQEIGSARAVKTRWEKIDDKDQEEQDPKKIFEPGCIFIEYGRPEATRDAAHSLHGRLYDNRFVKVEYVSKELYHMRFPSE